MATQKMWAEKDMMNLITSSFRTCQRAVNSFLTTIPDGKQCKSYPITGPDRPFRVPGD
jgi:hypothetical protein